MVNTYNNKLYSHIIHTYILHIDTVFTNKVLRIKFNYLRSSLVVGNTTQLLLLTANADQCVRVYSLDTTSTTTAGDGQQAVSEYTAGREGGREGGICNDNAH